MNHVLPIINGLPMLTAFDENETENLTDEGYGAIKDINELIVVEEEWDGNTWFKLLQGGFSHQVLEFSVKNLIAFESASFVKKVVDVFGLKHHFCNDFSTMIDNLK